MRAFVTTANDDDQSVPTRRGAAANAIVEPSSVGPARNPRDVTTGRPNGAAIRLDHDVGPDAQRTSVVLPIRVTRHVSACRPAIVSVERELTNARGEFAPPVRSDAEAGSTIPTRTINGATHR